MVSYKYAKFKENPCMGTDVSTPKSFSKFYQRHAELNVKYYIVLNNLLQQVISELAFYGDLVCKFKRIAGKHDCSDKFKKICTIIVC